jgi:hypothetical protein
MATTKDGTVEASVERNPNPKAGQPWIALLGPMKTKKRFVSRTAAVQQATRFLTLHDPRMKVVEQEYRSARAAISSEYEAIVEAETVADDDEPKGSN